jgi:hypothetical protein
MDKAKKHYNSQQLVVKRQDGGTRLLENYGHKWAHFQTQFFQSNSQPFYVLLSPDAKTILTPPVGYTPDSQEYEAFLNCGLDVLFCIDCFLENRK